MWEFDYKGKYYNIRSSFSGHFIAVGEGLKQENLQLVTWTMNNLDEQRWLIVRTLPELEIK